MISPSFVKDVLKEYPQLEEPLYIVEAAVLEEKISTWKACLPMVRPFYAVKCNGHPFVLKKIHGTGWGFDCASEMEIKTALSTGQDPKDIIFANPCKAISHINTARQAGVTKTTFDSVEELHKFKKHWPMVEALLRVAVDDSGSLCQLSSKFGAPVSACPKLLQQAKDLGINVVGISFHVGSGSSDETAFARATRSVLPVWKTAEAIGFDMQLLDIGGGFPGDDDRLFSIMAGHLAVALSECFPDVPIIAEPGRYFGTAAFTLVCPIIGKKRPVVDDDCTTRYFLADGTYASFNNLVYDHATVTPVPIRYSPEDDIEMDTPRKEIECTLFGPTCDSIDRIMDVKMEELDVGDFVVFANMGAYTFSAACDFNGFQTGKLFHFVYSAG